MRLVRNTPSDSSAQRTDGVVLSPAPPLAPGVAEQFREFYERMHPIGRDFAEQLTSRMEAEDAVHDAMTDVWLKWLQRGPAPLEDRFFLAIVRHKVYRQGRTNQRMVSLQDVDETSVEFAYGGSPRSMRGESPADFLDLAIKALPAKRREVFLLAQEHEYTYKEVGTAMRVSEQTVKTHLRLATADLREAFATAGYVSGTPRQARLRAADPIDAQTDAQTDTGGAIND